MSDTIIKFYAKALDAFSNSLTLDGIFIFGELLIAIAFVCLVAYKFASFDYEILYSSRNVIKFMRLPKSKRLYGSLNYYMRSFPNDISHAWEKYFLDRVGKPSDFLTRDLASNYGVFESGLKPIMPLVVAFATLINLVFALQYKKLPLTSTLIMPIFTLAFGIVCIIALNIFFNVIKRLSAKKYCEMVRLLDFHSLSDFASFLTPKNKTAKVISKISEDIPLQFKRELEFSKPIDSIPFDAKAPTLSATSESKDVVNVQESFKERILESENPTNELESLAVNLTLAKKDEKTNEQTLNDAINNLMNTIAQGDAPKDVAN